MLPPPWGLPHKDQRGRSPVLGPRGESTCYGPKRVAAEFNSLEAAQAWNESRGFTDHCRPIARQGTRFGTSTAADRRFTESTISGDSGNPAFLILDLGSGPELVLLTVWTGGGAGSGTFVSSQIDDLNAAIATADANAGNGGTGYTITEADLSGFTSFNSHAETITLNVNGSTERRLR